MVYEAGCDQLMTSVGPPMEITQITIPVCQVRFHVHVFQAGKKEWPAKSGHCGKGKLGF